MSNIEFLIIASDYKPKPGGRADYIDNLAKGLRKIGAETRVLAIAQSYDEKRLAFLDQYAEWVIPFPILHDKRPGWWPGNKLVSLLEILRCVSPRAQRLLDETPLFTASKNAVVRLGEVLDSEQPKMVVFGHLDIRLYAFALCLLQRQVPYGIIAHESEVYPFRNRKNDLVRRGMMVRGAQWIAANSRHTKSLVELWDIPADKIKIVHPPISEDAITAPLKGLRSSTTSVGELKIVTVCRLVESKGVDTVLRALRLLNVRGIPFRYVLCGDGPNRKALESLANELGLESKVHFMGYITDAQKWRMLEDSDVFVMPSRIDPKAQHEGFGIAFVEAAALGIPSIGSNQGGIPDAVIDDETGMLVPPDSPPHLAAALETLYGNPEKRIKMGRVGRERAIKQFSPTAVASHFQGEIAKYF